jgi:hypothetical protein
MPRFHGRAAGAESVPVVETAAGCAEVVAAVALVALPHPGEGGAWGGSWRLWDGGGGRVLEGDSGSWR